MRRFAYLYMALFLLDGGLSLIDELLAASGATVPLLPPGRLLVAYTVIALSAVMYACLGIDRRLPKRVFLPMILYISWCTVAMWPLSGVIGHASLPLVASIGQLVIVLLSMVLLRGRILLPEALFLAPSFSLRNTLGFTVVTLLLGPFVLIFATLAVVGNYLEEQTAGFLRISPVGIYMAERSYHLGAKEVRLVGMMHIGREEYYRELTDALSTEATIILTEGVTDRDRLLEHPFDYRRLAGVIGVSSQDRLRLDGNQVDLEALERVAKGGEGKPDIAWADIDLNRFDPQTVDFLNALGRTLFSGRPLAVSLAEYNAWINEAMTPERIAGVMADILDQRNEAVITGLFKALGPYDTIIVPWGAMHMPAIEAAVLARGFVPGDKTERMSLDFRALPYAELWHKWSRSFNVEPPVPTRHAG